MHDSRVFRYSELQHMCNNDFFYEDSHLLGDSAYTLQDKVMTPYRDDGHLTPQQTYYNTILSRNRVMAECAIGVLKMRWRRLLDMCDMRLVQLIPFYVVTCCILHNICVKRNINEYEWPLFPPDNNLIYRGPMAPNVGQKVLGAEKRIDITQQLYDNL